MASVFDLIDGIESVGLPSPAVRYVATRLALYAGSGGGFAFPQIRTLAEKTGYNRDTIRLAIKHLIDAGIIYPHTDGWGRKGWKFHPLEAWAMPDETASMPDDTARMPDETAPMPDDPASIEVSRKQKNSHELAPPAGSPTGGVKVIKFERKINNNDLYDYFFTVLKRVSKERGLLPTGDVNKVAAVKRIKTLREQYDLSPEEFMKIIDTWVEDTSRWYGKGKAHPLMIFVTGTVFAEARNATLADDVEQHRPASHRDPRQFFGGK